MKVVVELVAESWNEIQSTTIYKSWQKIISVTTTPSDTPKLAAIRMARVNYLPEILADALHEGYDQYMDQPATHVTEFCKSKSYFLWRGVRCRFQENEKEKNKVITSSQEGCSGDELGVLCFKSLFQELGLTAESEEITTWLESDVNDPGVQMLTDSEICDFVSNGSDLQIDSDKEQGDFKEPSRCPVSHSEAAHMFEQCLRCLECQPEASVYNTSVFRQLHTLSASKTMNSIEAIETQCILHTQGLKVYTLDTCTVTCHLLFLTISTLMIIIAVLVGGVSCIVDLHVACRMSVIFNTYMY